MYFIMEMLGGNKFKVCVLYEDKVSFYFLFCFRGQCIMEKGNGMSGTNVLLQNFEFNMSSSSLTRIFFFLIIGE